MINSFIIKWIKITLNCSKKNLNIRQKYDIFRIVYENYLLTSSLHGDTPACLNIYDYSSLLNIQKIDLFISLKLDYCGILSYFEGE